MDEKPVLLEERDVQIIMAYAVPERLRKYEKVYKGLAEKYSSLRPPIERLEKGINTSPFEIIEKFKKEVSMCEVMILSFSLGSESKDEDKEDIEEGFGRLVASGLEVCKMCRLGIAHDEELLLNLITKAKELSKEKNADPVKELESQEFRDTVFKAAFPTRKEAENNMNYSNQFIINIFKLAHYIFQADFKFLESTIKDEGSKDGKGFEDDVNAINEQIEELKRNMKKLLAPEAIEAFIEESKDYEMKEFDRIYG